MNHETDLLNRLSLIKNADLDKREKITRLLQLGCERFSLMLGVVSRIERADYIVEAAYPEGLINSGERFPLGDTICNETRHHTGVTSFTKASGTRWVEHPAYEKFSIEAYIGCNYTIATKNVGTINFSSPTALGHEFSESDKQAIILLSRNLSEILQS